MTKVVRFDWAMKKLLRDKANFYVLEGFFGALLEQEIVTQGLLEDDQNSEYHRENQINLLVKNKRGKLILIQLQAEREERFFHHLAYSTSKLVAQYVKGSKSYGSIEKIISVSMTYLGPGEGTDYAYHGSTHFVGMNRQEPLQPTDIQKTLYGISGLHEIFVEHYLLRLENFNGHVSTPLDEWVYMMQNGEVRADFTSKHIQDAGEKLKYTKLNRAERLAHDRYMENLHYQASMEKTRRADLEAIIAERHERGFKRGQNIQNIIIARKLLQMGMTTSQIVEITSLPEDEIEQLRNE